MEVDQPITPININVEKTSFSNDQQQDSYQKEANPYPNQFTTTHIETFIKKEYSPKRIRTIHPYWSFPKLNKRSLLAP